jgi:hypothetical protein
MKLDSLTWFYFVRKLAIQKGLRNDLFKLYITTILLYGISTTFLLINVGWSGTCMLITKLVITTTKT